MAGERILIVDDEQSIRSLLGRLCTREGYEVVLASDGTEGLAALEQGAIDVSIVDLYLPDMYGIEVLRRIKEAYPRCEVIILTGHGDLQSAIEAMRLGAYDYLQKPVPSLQIIALTIARALERQRLSRDNAQLIENLQQANQAIETTRQRQLSYMRDLGQILAGSLRLEDVSDVLIRAMLGLTHCDAAVILLLPQDAEAHPLASIGAHLGLAESAQTAMVERMASELSALAPVIENVEVRYWAEQPDQQQQGGWQNWAFERLEVRETTLGILALARRQDAPFDQTELDVLGVLVSQGTTALDNVYLFERMRHLATQDRLTGLYNHGHFFELLEAEISRSERHATELAVIMFDIDRNHGLKAVNDTYGHQAGDMLLYEFGQLLKSSLRRADIVARYGGDEFVILAPQTTRRSAIALAERICERVRNTPFAVTTEHTASITVSGGVTVFYPGSGLSAADIVRLADQGAYAAKDQGGDRIRIVDAPHAI